MNTSPATPTPLHPMPENASGTLLVDLMATRDTVKELYRATLARHDLTEQQWRVLSALWALHRLDATRLAERAAVLPSSLTRIVSGLEARGYLNARRDPSDARRTELRLSADGRALMESLAPEIDRIEARIASAVGAARLEALLRALTQTRTALSDIAPERGLRPIG